MTRRPVLMDFKKMNDDDYLQFFFPRFYGLIYGFYGANFITENSVWKLEIQFFSTVWFVVRFSSTAPVYNIRVIILEVNW